MTSIFQVFEAKMTFIKKLLFNMKTKTDLKHFPLDNIAKGRVVYQLKAENEIKNDKEPNDAFVDVSDYLTIIAPPTGRYITE